MLLVRLYKICVATVLPIEHQKVANSCMVTREHLVSNQKQECSSNVNGHHTFCK